MSEKDQDQDQQAAKATRRVRMPKDEERERAEYLLAERVKKIALENLEFAHERVKEHQEAGRWDAAQSESYCVMEWFDRLTGWSHE